VPIFGVIFGAGGRGWLRWSSILELAARRICRATMASETTRDDRRRGVTRRDPMADAALLRLQQWRIILALAEMGKKIPTPHRRYSCELGSGRPADGEITCGPGRGERARVKWIWEAGGRTAATRKETPIGYVPRGTGWTLDGLKISPEALDELFRVNAEDWETDPGISGKTSIFCRRFGAVRRSCVQNMKAMGGRFQQSDTA